MIKSLVQCNIPTYFADQGCRSFDGDSCEKVNNYKKKNLDLKRWNGVSHLDTRA